MTGGKSFIVIVNKSDLSIVNIYQSSVPTPHLYGSEWGNLEKYVHMSVPESVDVRGILCTQDVNGKLTLKTDPVKLNAVIQHKITQSWKNVRARRNQLLRMSDWVVTVPDASNVNDDKKTQWIAYRQQLRDVPQNNSDPDNIIWPPAPNS